MDQTASIRRKKIYFWSSVAGIASFEVGFLILTHYFLHSKLGETTLRSTILVVIMGMLISWPTFKGLRAAYRIRFRGDSVDQWMEHLGKGSYWFWITAPLLLFVFSFIYSMPLVLLVGLISVPFGERATSNLNLIILFCRILSFIFAFWTVLWLWKMLKPKRVRK